MIESIGAITLATHTVRQRRQLHPMIGFDLAHGGADAASTSFRAGRRPSQSHCRAARSGAGHGGGASLSSYLDVDGLHRRVIAAGYRPDTQPPATANGASASSTYAPTGRPWLSFAHRLP